MRRCPAPEATAGSNGVRADIPGTAGDGAHSARPGAPGGLQHGECLGSSWELLLREGDGSLCVLRLPSYLHVCCTALIIQERGAR